MLIDTIFIKNLDENTVFDTKIGSVISGEGRRRLCEMCKIKKRNAINEHSREFKRSQVIPTPFI